MALPVQIENPAAQCPKCARFTAYCPHCLRLRPLGARACPTARCARANILPREPFAAHGGRAGGAPVLLQTPWHNARPTLMQPGAKSPSVAQRCGGVAARYGQLVWWKENKLHLWAAPQPGAHWPGGLPQSVESIEPLFRGGLFPHREALLLAHGHAYLLGNNAAMRVPLGQENANKQTLAVGDFDESSEWMRATSDDGAPLGVAASWQAHEVEWMAQTETADGWFAIGSVGETLVGATVRGSSALFEGERWQLPVAVDLNDWQELLAWNNAPVLRCERALWHQRDGIWSRIFELASGETSLDGALVCEPCLWVWGQEAGRLWVERLNVGETRAASAQLRPSMPFAATDRLMCVPVAWETRITFFVAGSQQGAATLDVAEPLEAPQMQQLTAATEVLWTAAAAYGESQWLIYALDDGELVRFFLLQQSPQPAPPLQLMQFRPFRDPYLQSKGATLAATISGDCLVISYIGHKGAESGVWMMAYSLG